MLEEFYEIQVLGSDRTKLLIMLPISLPLNTIVALIMVLVKLLTSLLNPLLFLATLIDVPLVLGQAVFGGIIVATTGRRKTPASDFDMGQRIDLEAGHETVHRSYGRCRLIEVQVLNEENIPVERRLPRG